MKKKLLTLILPVVIAISCSFAVWANEPTAAQPACDKCPKADKAAPVAKTAPAAKDAAGCDKCAKMKAAEGKPCGEKGCDKQAMAAAQGCDKCPKMKAAEGKPCGEKGCDKSAMKQQTKKKSCCDKDKL
jgi:hypothetical protein